ncbi:phytanoyl-CoA dioxygenase family protein [Hahella aquimaris]|uniref:phytanoyl-CoA dioxygenase family protein n=1 Tax=Hahella sp. HNIBRBA332 TaxID=3015983 RepID=UPI00273C601D|nr:phytanoyl-CoA dioxygenase family protein [Hahella sp. HNIBRBA332]WLQ17244.1 phytanoyl-CoA dioxygenase family protein [Hahella sp. HNIBRBA332]
MKQRDEYKAPGNRSVSDPCGVQLKDIRKQLPLRVLSESDFEFWRAWGYVIIPNAVDAEQVRAVQSLLWEFTEMDPEDAATWSKPQLRQHEMKELNNSGMVECYHHQALWVSRQTQRVYDAFVDIWDREDLWVTIDRANLNTPNRDGRQFSGFIHWDADSTMVPPPIGVQGVLALSDTDERCGGFQCVPQLFHDFERWKQSQPAGRDPWVPDLTGYEPEFIPMRKGDLLIFNSLLAHGIRPNQSDRVRMAQYISMAPANESDEEMRQWRVDSWREHTPPQGFAFPGDPREWEKTRYPQARLSPLGEKLLGLKSWRESHVEPA